MNAQNKADFGWEGIYCFADESLLAKDWLSREDEEAFAYLQNS